MMTREDKTLQLRRHITKELGNLIDRNYVLMGLPYYLNIGDILIWEGERQFLNTYRYKCLNAGYHYSDYSKIGDETLIFLQGGGNFGDLWRPIQEERLSIIQRYKNNPIIISPVTCYYENKELLEQDAKIFSKHPNLTICARDKLSLNLLERHFSNRILLVPDMAFFIERKDLRRQIHHKGKGTLFLKRTDKELAPYAYVKLIDMLRSADVRDWPSMEKNPLCWKLYRTLCKSGHYIKKRFKFCQLSRIILKSSDWYYHELCREHLIREGIRFVNRYRNIYTTRLHVGILSILLDKEVTIFDNSYGKNSSFFETWFRNTEGVTLWITK